MLAAAACNVFVVILGAPFIAIAWSNHPTAYRHLLRIPFWFPWLLAGVFAAKVVVTLAMMEYADHRGWVKRRSVRRYVMAWFATTGCLALTAWLLIPVQGWAKWCSALLSLFAVPLLRVAYAPIALDQNRRQ